MKVIKQHYLNMEFIMINVLQNYCSIILALLDLRRWTTKVYTSIQYALTTAPNPIIFICNSLVQIYIENGATIDTLGVFDFDPFDNYYDLFKDKSHYFNNINKFLKT